MTKYRVTIAHESVPPGEPVEYWDTPAYKEGERTMFLVKPFEYEGTLKEAIEQALAEWDWHLFSIAGHTGEINIQRIYAIEEIHGDEVKPIDWLAELLQINMNSREELYDKLGHYEECITYLTSKLSQKQKESFYKWLEKRGIYEE